MKQKDTDIPKWDFYIAEISDAVFEWPEPYAIGEYDARVHCEQYLDQIFNNQYKITKFYFKEKGLV